VILNYILSKYPESVNAIWRLANIYREESDTTKAIEYYKKSVELNPDKAPSKMWIEKLEKKD
jgi:tetratricopeptide (TPR) repeat protein